jgi:16S rRNA (cytidine1402-2'-O)-methyltransferase
VYESPNRVGQTLAELAAAGAAERATVVARELTKQYEETRRGPVSELAAYYTDASPRGEIVIVIAGADAGQVAGASEEQLRARTAELRAEGRSARDIATMLSSELGAPRNLAYRLAHE